MLKEPSDEPYFRDAAVIVPLVKDVLDRGGQPIPYPVQIESGAASPPVRYRLR